MQLPQAFVEEISRYPQLALLAESLLTEPETAVRVNRSKADESATIFDGDKVEWCAEGVRLRQRPQFTLDPRMHQGIYYVQDASSMAITAAIKEIAVNAPLRYLDVCAAPGGKTTAALAALPQGSIVVANEWDRHRADILCENVAKWGNPYTVVCRGDSSKLKKLGQCFDIVAVDAPCSGEGMMRKDAKAVEQWTPGLVRQCATLQRDILANAWEALSCGGHLIYSTCTFNRHENEENLLWLIEAFGAEPCAISALDCMPQIEKGIECEAPCYRFLPGRIRGEGLFMGIVRKPFGHSSASSEKRQNKVKFTKLPQIEHWFDSEVRFLERENEIYALPAECSLFMTHVAEKLDAIGIGTHAATVKGRDIVPAPELVLSQIYNRNALPSVEVGIEEAISYLHRDSFTLPDGTPKGYVVLNYQAIPLGLMKNLGTRANNLLPKPWSIRM